MTTLTVQAEPVFEESAITVLPPLPDEPKEWYERINPNGGFQIVAETFRQETEKLAKNGKDVVDLDVLQKNAMESATIRIAGLHSKVAQELLYAVFLCIKAGVFLTPLDGNEYGTVEEWAQAVLSEHLSDDYAMRLVSSVNMIAAMDGQHRNDEGKIIYAEDIIKNAPVAALKETYAVFENASDEDQAELARLMSSPERGKLKKIREVKNRVLGKAAFEAPDVYMEFLPDGGAKVELQLTAAQLGYFETRLGKDFLQNIRFAKPEDKG